MEAGILSPQNVDKVRTRLLNVDLLPTISTMFEKLIRLLEDEDTSVRELEKYIRMDQAISTRILKIINSALYGFSNITSISHAITLLGFNKVQNVVLSASLADVFNVEYPVGSLDVASFWLHSISTAHISRLLAEQTGLADPEEMFTLGLLHDVGKVAYLKEAPEFFEALVQHARDSQLSLYQAENQLGISHGHLGWFLCEKWNFPPKISTVTKKHHAPLPHSEFLTEESIVNMADYLALRLKLGQSGNFHPQAPSSLVITQLNISKKVWNQLKEKLKEQKESIIKLSNELLNI